MQTVVGLSRQCNVKHTVTVLLIVTCGLTRRIQYSIYSDAGIEPDSHIS
jgi:hypothetical protein